MKKIILAAAGVLALSACGGGAENNTAEANTAVSETDAGNAATDAGNSGEGVIPGENTTGNLGESAQNVGNALGNTAEAAGNAVATGAGAVANAADNAVTTEGEAKQ